MKSFRYVYLTELFYLECMAYKEMLNKKERPYDHYLLVRYDMETNKWNGITILNYSKHMEEFRAFPLPFKMDYDAIEHAVY